MTIQLVHMPRIRVWLLETVNINSRKLKHTERCLPKCTTHTHAKHLLIPCECATECGMGSESGNSFANKTIFPTICDAMVETNTELKRKEQVHGKIKWNKNSRKNVCVAARRATVYMGVGV